jgi:PAS domain S-box-containing protein
VLARAKVLSAELGCTIEAGFESFAAKARLGQIDENEWTLIRKDASRFPVTLSATRLVDSNGAIAGFLFVLADIIERKRAEHALRESEERFRRSFEDATIGLALVSLEGRWLRVNRPICEIVGYSESELLATDFQTITHPDDLQTDLNLVHQQLDGKIRDYRMEKRYFHKQSQVVNVHLSVSLVRGADDKPLYFVSQNQDITETKRYAAEREKLILELQQTLADVITLSGMRPICAGCKKIRDDRGYWKQVEVYVMDHSDAHFSHGLCPNCEKTFKEDAAKMFRTRDQSPENKKNRHRTGWRPGDLLGACAQIISKQDFHDSIFGRIATFAVDTHQPSGA